MVSNQIRTASTQWQGPLIGGHGKVSLDSSGSAQFAVDWSTRSGAPHGRTSPEELLAAAHSACFAMALARALAASGTPAKTLNTHADIIFQSDAHIAGIRLTVRASVPGVSTKDFVRIAQKTKRLCPVSKALAGTMTTLIAYLV